MTWLKKNILKAGVVAAVVTTLFTVNGCSSNAKGDDTYSGNEPEAVYVLLDASGENYNCDALRKANLKAVKIQTAKFIREGNVDVVYAGVFSKYVDLTGHVYQNLSLAEGLRKKRLMRRAKALIDEVYKSMNAKYSRMVQGREKPYGRDVVGALEMVINRIKRNGNGKSHIIIGSTMIQSVNKAEVVARLKNNPIVLPEKTDLTVFHKAWVCSDAPEYKKNDSMHKTEAFWRSVIQGDLFFDNAY